MKNSIISRKLENTPYLEIWAFLISIAVVAVATGLVMLFSALT